MKQKSSFIDNTIRYFKSYLPIRKAPTTGAIENGNQGRLYSSLVMSARNVLWQADISQQENYQLADKMLQDPALMSSLFKRMQAVAQLKFEILPENPSDKRQQIIAKKVEDIIRRTPYLIEIFKQLEWAIWSGTGVVELRWTQCKQSNIWYIANFRAHSGDKVFADLWGNLRIQTIDFQTGGRELLPEELDKLIIHKWNPSDGQFYMGQQAAYVFKGRGLRDIIWYYWLMQHQSLRFWQLFEERYAGGYFIGKYPLGNNDMKNAMENVLKNIYDGTSISLPMPSNADEQAVTSLDSVAMDGKDGTGKLYNDFVDGYCNKYMKLMIEGSSLTSQTGSTGLGSNVADKHQDSLENLVKFDATLLQDTLTLQLIEKIVRFNFGELGFSLKFQFITEEQDREQDLKSIELAEKLNLPMSKEFLYTKLGIPMPQIGDELLIPMNGQAPSNPNKPLFPDKIEDK